jgi:hypothetical protein
MAVRRRAARPIKAAGGLLRRFIASAALAFVVMSNASAEEARTPPLVFGLM